MAEIEFLDGPHTPPSPPLPSEVPQAPDTTAGSVPPVWRRTVLRQAVGPVLWAVAAVLTFIAPFHMLYRLRVRAYDFGGTEQVDGWGRLATNDNLPFAEHNPRYGVLSCVVAGLFLLAAATTVAHLICRVRRRGPQRGISLGRVGAALGVCGVGVLAATIGAGLLDLQAVSNNIDAQLAAPTNDQAVVNTPARTGALFDLGAMVWLSVAATAVALVALVCVLVQSRRRGPAVDDTAPTAAVVPEPQADDPDHIDDDLIV